MKVLEIALGAVQARKKNTKINFLGPETTRWGGGLPREGVVAEKFVPSCESLSSLAFEEMNLGYPENFAGMSRTYGVVQKVCAKKVRARFSFPNSCCPDQVLLSKTLGVRPGCRQKSLVRNSGVGGEYRNLILSSRQSRSPPPPSQNLLDRFSVCTFLRTCRFTMDNKLIAVHNFS